MVYVDSNIFIFALLADDQNAARSRSLLNRIATNEISASTSTLTWDEIVWSVRKFLGIEDALLAGKKFLEFPFLTFLDVGEPILRKAQELMQRYRLKPRDAIHVAAALSRGIKEIISEDKNLDVVRELKRRGLRSAPPAG
jgi:hypothetical protein